MPKSKEQYKEIREERKLHIISVALELFANSGYHNTSISKIAKEAKISKGLMYNYFESKDDLLRAIIIEISDDIMLNINPNGDDEIDDEEALFFIDRLVDSLTENTEKWKLFYQLAMQPEVFEKLLDAHAVEELAKNQQVFLRYFMEREFDDPHVDMLIFSSLIKGFGMQYVFAPEMFSDELINRFKEKFKKLFLRPKRKGDLPDMNLSRETGYLLT